MVGADHRPVVPHPAQQCLDIPVHDSLGVVFEGAHVLTRQGLGTGQDAER